MLVDAWESWGDGELILGFSNAKHVFQCLISQAPVTYFFYQKYNSYAKVNIPILPQRSYNHMENKPKH